LLGSKPFIARSFAPFHPSSLFLFRTGSIASDDGVGGGNAGTFSMPEDELITLTVSAGRGFAK
jgi:hypothetical protein